MSSHAPPTYVLQRTFADVEDLATEAKQWDVDFRQIERGRFRGELLQFASGGVHISEARFCRSLNQKGAPPAGMRTVAIPACRNLRFEWRNKQVDGDCLMLFPIGAELSSVSGPDFHVFTCSFPDELLTAMGESMELGGIHEVSGGIDALRVGSEAIRRLRQCLTMTARLARNAPHDLATAKAAGLLTRELPRRLLAAIATGRDDCRLAISEKRQAAIARAEKYIELHATRNLKISDLSRVAGVSERTLQYAFVRRFGIGPKEFLNAFRLQQVHRQLRSADPAQTSVSDVANAWGFWHMGQFAADYRARFAELPSVTLCSSR